MYIFVKASLPSHKMVAVAHGVLICHKIYLQDPDYIDWITNSFRKVVCEVTDDEFEELKLHEKHAVVTESGLKGMEVALVFCPRPDWPPHFKQFKFSPY